MSALRIRELVQARQEESLELWARTINPQFARVLKTIGFDRTWVRAEGAHLWDADGNRFLDLLGGFGMFNVGRNNPHSRGTRRGTRTRPARIGAARRLAAAAAPRGGTAAPNAGAPRAF